MTEKIKEFAQTIGIEMIGFSKYYVDENLKARHQNKFNLKYDVPLNYDPIKASDPSYLLKSVKTIITIALPYYKTCEQLENLTKDEVYFSSSSWGKDYHLVLDEKLEQLVIYLKKYYPDLEYVKCVDTKPIDDRFWAYKSGIGFFGKNGLLINEKYGSYIFIGNLLTNLNLNIKENIKKTSCTNCNQCVSSCPNQAINDNGINSRKCLSYLTQKKGELSETEKENFNNCIYGCDICMQVCPYNHKLKKGYHEFKPSGIEFINTKTFQPMSNREFKKKYGKLAGSWRGKKNVERNIKIYQEKIDNKSSMC